MSYFFHIYLRIDYNKIEDGDDMKTQKELIYEHIISTSKSNEKEVTLFTTLDIATFFEIHRSNASALLNELVREGLLKKDNSRPVKYSLVNDGKEKEESGVFKNVIGASSSLKNQVQLAKAAMLYPEQVLPTLLSGQRGTGKGFLAFTMYEYAKEMKLINQNAEFITINCRDFSDVEALNEALFIGSDSFIDKLRIKDNLFIHLKNVDVDDVIFKNNLESVLREGLMLVCSVEKNSKNSLSDLFTVVLELPTLKQRTLQERYKFIQLFLTQEAIKMKRNIQLNAELLRNLLLYDVETNIHQLGNDIRLGCANAFVREFRNDSDYLYVFLQDFPNYVRKGFLYYKRNKNDIENLIPSNYDYIFSEESVEISENILNKKSSIYEVIEKKYHTLKDRGLNQEEINGIISIDLENDFQKYNESKELTGFTKQSILKIIDPKIVDSVEKFLNHASEALNRIFSNSTFYGLCMHLSSSITKKDTRHFELQEREDFIKEHYPKEYELVTDWMTDIETEFLVTLPLEERIFLTMFLTEKEKPKSNRPVVLVATHGDSTATSLVNVVNDLLAINNVYAFNLNLDKPLEVAYEELKDIVLQIDQGKGILFIFDMGSLKTMIESISNETGIPVKVIEVPITTIALEASRKSSLISELDDLYVSLKNSYETSYEKIRDVFASPKLPKAIVTLCMTGEGGAVYIKEYLEDNLVFDNVDIVPLAISDREMLHSHLNDLRKKQEIISIIGTYNPEIYGIPFISISQIFDTPVEKLNLLISSGDSIKPNYIDYATIYSYLAEQMPELDIHLIKSELPRVLRSINKLEKLSLDQELGLFIHIASNIYHHQEGKMISENIKTHTILQSNKRLYYSLKDVFENIEEEFLIEFRDDDYANMISIIKKI